MKLCNSLFWELNMKLWVSKDSEMINTSERTYFSSLIFLNIVTFHTVRKRSLLGSRHSTSDPYLITMLRAGDAHSGFQHGSSIFPNTISRIVPLHRSHCSGNVQSFQSNRVTFWTSTLPSLFVLPPDGVHTVIARNQAKVLPPGVETLLVVPVPLHRVEAHNGIQHKWLAFDLVGRGILPTFDRKKINLNFEC